MWDRKMHDLEYGDKWPHTFRIQNRHKASIKHYYWLMVWLDGEWSSRIVCRVVFCPLSSILIRTVAWKWKKQCRYETLLIPLHSLPSFSLFPSPRFPFLLLVSIPCPEGPLPRYSVVSLPACPGRVRQPTVSGTCIPSSP